MSENIKFDQYKLYAELTDKISERRQKVATIYISLLTFLLSLLSLTIKDNHFTGSIISLLIVYFSGISVSVIWFANIASYKQLNKIKFKVLHELENDLPFKGFQREWEIEKEEKHKYIRLTKIEGYMPIFFGVMFTVILIYILVKNYV